MREKSSNPPILLCIFSLICPSRSEVEIQIVIKAGGALEGKVEHPLAFIIRNTGTSLIIFTGMLAILSWYVLVPGLKEEIKIIKYLGSVFLSKYP